MFSECITGAFAMYWLATKQAVCFRRRPISYKCLFVFDSGITL